MNEKEFLKEFDWMYRRMACNLPITEHYDLRKSFEDWWKQLAEIVTEKQKEEVKEIIDK